MSTKQNLCRYVIFSPNCCFVDKGLVDDSTTAYVTFFHKNLLQDFFFVEFIFNTSQKPSNLAFISSALHWQKEASDKSDISCKRVKCFH